LSRLSSPRRLGALSPFPGLAARGLPWPSFPGGGASGGFRRKWRKARRRGFAGPRRGRRRTGADRRRSRAICSDIVSGVRRARLGAKPQDAAGCECRRGLSAKRSGCRARPRWTAPPRTADMMKEAMTSAGLSPHVFERKEVRAAPSSKWSGSKYFLQGSLLHDRGKRGLRSIFPLRSDVRARWSRPSWSRPAPGPFLPTSRRHSRRGVLAVFAPARTPNADISGSG